MGKHNRRANSEIGCMQNSMRIFTCFVLILNIFLGHIWSKTSKPFVQNEIGYLDYFEYAEFNGGVYRICFKLEKPFLGKFGPRNENYQIQLKLGT